MCSLRFGYHIFELTPHDFRENEKLAYKKGEDGKIRFYKFLDIKDGKHPLILPILNEVQRGTKLYKPLFC